MEFFITRDGQEYGPYSEDQIRQYTSEGSLTSEDLAWHVGADAWSPLSSFTAFCRTSTPPPAPVQHKAQRPVEMPGISADLLGEYVRSTLQPNETALYKTRIHWIVFVRAGFLALFSLVLLVNVILMPYDQGFYLMWLAIALLLPVLILTPAIITYCCSELVITDKRVLIKVGFISRRTVEMFISKIESIGVDQGIFGRLCGFGTVAIRGTGGSMEPFRNIAKPLEFRNCVQSIQSHSESKP